MTETTTSTTLAPLARYLQNPHSANEAIGHAVGERLYVVIPFVAFVIVSGIVAWCVTAVLRSQLSRRWRNERDHVVFEVQVPPSIDERSAEMLWRNLHDLLRPRWRRFLEGQPHLSFEMVWNGPQLRFCIWVPAALSAPLVERAIVSAWPGAIVARCEDEAIVPDDAMWIGSSLRLGESEAFPIETESRVDPLRFVIGAVGSVSDSQGAVVQVLARPATIARSLSVRAVAEGRRSGRTRAALWLLDLLTPGPGRVPATRQAVGSDVMAKTSALGWDVVVRYGVYDRDDRTPKKLLEGNAHALAASFSVFSGRNRFARAGRCRVVDLNERRLTRGQLFSVRELAAIAHLPGDTDMPVVDRAGARSVAPVAAVPAEGKVLGEADGGRQRRVAIGVEDARYHLHVMGATGSGKSTLLTNLIVQDAEANRGVVVIDPKGDLVVDVLQRLDDEKLAKVVLIDPTREGVLPSLDVLGADDDPKMQHLVVENLASIFRQVFATHWGPRTDDVFRAACLTLMYTKKPQPSLVQLPILLTNAEYRREFTKSSRANADLRVFWDSYEQLGDAQQQQMIGPLLNKLRAFLMREFVSQTIGLSSQPVNFDKVLDGGILLVRIPKGLIGDETVRLIGSMIVAKVWQSATARSTQVKDARRDAALYVDECQNFLNLPRSFDEILAEARGYGLSLVMAHQHLGQLNNDLREGVSANARNKVWFTMSPEDARVLERHVAPSLGAHDLSHLGAYQMAVRAVVNGREQPVCTVRASVGRDILHDDVDALLRSFYVKPSASESDDESHPIHGRLMRGPGQFGGQFGGQSDGQFGGQS